MGMGANKPIARVFIGEKAVAFGGF